MIDLFLGCQVNNGLNLFLNFFHKMYDAIVKLIKIDVIVIYITCVSLLVWKYSCGKSKHTYITCFKKRIKLYKFKHCL